MKQLVSFLALFSSIGTLFCCALPALFVTLGFGAAFAGLTSSFPQLIWISSHKNAVFVVATIFLILSVVLQRMFPPPVQCDVNGNPCETTRAWTTPLMYIAFGIYSIGGFFAYFAHLLL